MELFNLKDQSEKVSFKQAVKQGLGKHQGLFFPQHFEPIADPQSLLALPFAERSAIVLKHLIGAEYAADEITSMVEQAFTFEAPVAQIENAIYSLELFHGPTLAFKDFGGRFMAQCLSGMNQGQRVTILTATSGDTGAAVAHAFYGMDNIDVVILYPKGKISLLQQKLFTTLGGNIHTYAVEGDFDQCQQLVKTAFDDPEVRQDLGLNSANSINISRLLAQVCYYFEAFAQLPDPFSKEWVVSVPSGNFGNLTAGLIAKALGLPVKRFIAATNANDTVPRYLKNGNWAPNATVETMSNAMDVSRPNNWPRVEALLKQGTLDKHQLQGVSVDEESTQIAIRHLAKLGYTSEPHAAIAYFALQHNLEEGESGLFLATAHPAKFRETVENVLGQPIQLPEVLAECAAQKSLSETISADYQVLKTALHNRLNRS